MKYINRTWLVTTLYVIGCNEHFIIKIYRDHCGLAFFNENTLKTIFKQLKDVKYVDRLIKAYYVINFCWKENLYWKYPWVKIICILTPLSNDFQTCKKKEAERREICLHTYEILLCYWFLFKQILCTANFHVLCISKQLQEDYNYIMVVHSTIGGNRITQKNPKPFVSNWPIHFSRLNRAGLTGV